MLRLTAVFVGTLFALPAWAGLRAGVAKTDITPTTHEVMWGFEGRLEPAESTLDPLYARVLVLEAGGRRLAIVALDLGRSFGEPSLDRLRESARKSSGISCLLVCASHTHSAPIIQGRIHRRPARMGTTSDRPYRRCHRPGSRPSGGRENRHWNRSGLHRP